MIETTKFHGRRSGCHTNGFELAGQVAREIAVMPVDLTNYAIASAYASNVFRRCR